MIGMKHLGDKLISKMPTEMVQYYETKAFNQIVAYFSFQSVVLIIVSQSQLSRFRCHNWWLPFSLSLLSFVIFAINIADTIVEYLRAHLHQDSSTLLHMDSVCVNVEVDSCFTCAPPHFLRGSHRISVREGSAWLNPMLSRPLDCDPRRGTISGRMYMRFVGVLGTLLCALAVTVIVLLACYYVLCGNSE